MIEFLVEVYEAEPDYFNVSIVSGHLYHPV